jgi:hypothetical protein
VRHQQQGYATPEEAACSDIPPKFCKVVATEKSDDFAFVIIATNEPPCVEMYGVRCQRRDGLWYDHGGSSGTGSIWSSTSDDSDSGCLAWSSEAPSGADLVRVRLLGEDHEIEVQNGYCILLARDVPDTELPTIKSWRIEGEWK